jgi:hypothetical protein
MKRLAFLAFPLLCLSGPAMSADLDEPVYRERETVIERPLPPRIIGASKIARDITDRRRAQRTAKGSPRGDRAALSPSTAIKTARQSSW